YYVTAIDNEIPVNESAPSNTGDTPIELPLQDNFTSAGAPNPIIWRNVNAVVDSDAVNEPSAPFSLNLAGNTSGLGLDTVTTNSIDLSGRSGLGVTLAYWQQPQGTGDAPETADSLAVEALNSLGGWVTLKKLPGAAVRPFTFERFNMDSVNAAGGTFFFNGFKFRFRSRSSTVTTLRQDDWFVDDVFFGVPMGVPAMTVTPQNITDTVLVGKVDSTRYSFTITNTNPFATALNYTVTENPSVTWLSTSPSSGSVPGGSAHTIRVIINFASVPVGNYTTRLLVAGNDPANTVDTVTASFRVNPAPVIVTQPSSFTYTLNSGDSATANLKIKNTGLGPLAYTSSVTGGFAGDTTTNVGSTATNTTNINLLRGGVVGVTRTVYLREIRSYLGTTTTVELRFAVYQNTTATGTFTKIFETTVMAPIDTGYVSSGPVNMVLEAGKFYAIGVNWNSTLRYYWSTSPAPPIPISFGTITGGLAVSVFPPPATINQGTLSSLYHTQLITANGKWLNITSNASGTVNPGDSTFLGFRVSTSAVPGGTTNASLLVSSNDPVTPTVTTPVTLTVITAVTERGSGIPESYELSQNYPNPFNPTTKIEFALPEESIVRLKVYNILGQEVVTLANEPHPAGYFAAEWDGINNFGAKVSTGVYFYRMEATSTSGDRSFVSLKKMLMLK
ncbi:MAG: FlgD immunoglobulin-like domain containing protein, partial [Bacteroidota bacterium]